MDEADLLRESLRDITSLLILLHEKYLRDCSNITLALMTFVEDVNLSSSITIVDAERFRLGVMNNSRRVSMSHEEFYEWLRFVADHTYGNGDRRISLHNLIVRNIIPIARSESFLSKKSTKWLGNRCLIRLMSYLEFLLALFSSLSGQNTDMQFRWTPIFDYWERSKSRLHSISVASVVNQLERVGLERSLFDNTEFKEFVWTQFHSIESANNSRNVDFHSFLMILSFAANRLVLTEFQILGLGETPEIRVDILVITIAKWYLESAITLFCEFDTDATTSTFIRNLDSYPGGITVDSLLWWFRQGGLTQHDNFSIPWLYDEILAYDTKISESKNLYVASTQVAEIIARIAERVALTEFANIFSMTGVDSSGRCALYLAQVVPVMLFATPVRIPTPLGNLYSGDIIPRVRTILDSRQLFSVYWACASIAQSRGVNASNFLPASATAVTAESFWLLCEAKNLAPTIVPSELIRTTCEYVLGTSDANHHVCLGDFFELIYVLAQLCFEEFYIAESPDAELTVLRGSQPLSDDNLLASPKIQAILKVRVILECLISVESTSAPQSQEQVSINESVHEDVRDGSPKKELPVDLNNNGSSIRYLRDVLLLLVNFPLNSFDLNPWAIFQILLVKASPQRRASVQPASIVDTDSSDCLGGVFEEFCGVYKVSTQQLSEFFASFYTVPMAPNSAELGMTADLQRALQDPSLTYLLQDRNLQLLYANEDILQWEFCRLCIRHRSSDPFTVGIDTPCPTSEFVLNRPADALISSESILDWARSSYKWILTNPERDGNIIAKKSGYFLWTEIPPEIVEAKACAVLREVLLFSTTRDKDIGRASLTFSMFLQFAIRFWTLHIFNTSNYVEESAFTYSTVAAIELDDTYVSNAYRVAIKNMLVHIAQNLSEIQKRLQIGLLQPMFGFDSSSRQNVGDDDAIVGVVRDSSDSVIDATHLLSVLLTIYNTRFPPMEHPVQFFYLPPRPPIRFWDAPRIAEYLKMIGLLQFLGSSVCCWLGFGDYYSQKLANGRSERAGGCLHSGVAPFPVSISPSIIFDIIEFSCLNLSSTCAASTIAYVHGMSTMEFAVCQVIIPLAVGMMDESLNQVHSKPAHSISQNAPKTFEDLLRYGGDKMMSSLQLHSEFVDTLYNQLCMSCSELAEELSLPVACRYLSCNGMLRAGVVAVQAKRSLHPRLRSLQRSRTSMQNGIQSSNAEVTISRMEFEELFVRCALVAWEQVGATKWDEASFAESLEVESFYNSFIVDDKHLLNTVCRSCDSIITAPVDPVTGYLVSSPDQDIQQSHTNISGPAKTVKTAERYLREVLLQFSLRNTSELSICRVTSSWGTNYLAPFVVTMKEVMGMPVISKTKLDSVDELRGVNSKFYSDSNYPYWPNLGRSFGSPVKAIGSSSDSLQASENVDSSPRLGESHNCELFVRRLDPKSSIAETEETSLPPELYSHFVVEPSMLVRGTSTTNSIPSSSITQSVPLNSSLVGMMRNLAPPSNTQPLSFEAMGSQNSNEKHDGILDRQSTNLASRSTPPTVNSTVSNTDAMTANRRRTSPSGPLGGSAVPISALLDGTKEALWPIYATYCSCGDSNEPGKLSGPNLFSLLSKLGILTDDTLLSDVGVLIHQISAYAHAQNPLDATSIYVDSIFESPSLTFEEFIVFLCAFAQLRFDGVVAAVPVPFLQGGTSGRVPLSEHQVRPIGDGPSNSSGQRRSAASRSWFAQWKSFMETSSSFRILLQDFVLPILQRHPLLAFPEDARHRDRYGTIFSLEVLLAVEGAEPALKAVFQRHRSYTLQREGSTANAGLPKVRAISADDEFEIKAILGALRRINLLPRVITEQQVYQLVRDVLPAAAASGRPPGSSVQGEAMVTAIRSRVLFPQWEWVLCVVAYEAVDIAVRESQTFTNPEKIPSLVAEIVTSIARAMRAV